MNNNLPIGVFDSGVGGLTVLTDLMKEMPNENFIYVADEANCPYGTKSPEEIKKCVINIVKFLDEKHVKAIVIACNTASNFIDEIKKITNTLVISCIEPTATTAKEMSKNKKIGVIATEATVKIGKYQKLLESFGTTCFSVACSEFVEIVENNEVSLPSTKLIIEKNLKTLKEKDIDTLIFGCTHFPLLKEQIKDFLGDINYVSSGSVVAQTLKSLLKQNNLLTTNTKAGTLDIYTTSTLKIIKDKIKWFTIPYRSINEIGE